MNTHERFIAAVMDSISNPSPAIIAYIENYQASLPALRSDDESEFAAAIDLGMTFLGGVAGR